MSLGGSSEGSVKEGHIMSGSLEVPGSSLEEHAVRLGNRMVDGQDFVAFNQPRITY